MRRWPGRARRSSRAQRLWQVRRPAAPSQGPGGPRQTWLPSPLHQAGTAPRPPCIPPPPRTTTTTRPRPTRPPALTRPPTPRVPLHRAAAPAPSAADTAGTGAAGGMLRDLQLQQHAADEVSLPLRIMHGALRDIAARLLLDAARTAAAALAQPGSRWAPGLVRACMCVCVWGGGARAAPSLPYLCGQQRLVAGSWFLSSRTWPSSGGRLLAAAGAGPHARLRATCRWEGHLKLEEARLLRPGFRLVYWTNTAVLPLSDLAGGRGWRGWRGAPDGLAPAATHRPPFLRRCCPWPNPLPAAAQAPCSPPFSRKAAPPWLPPLSPPCPLPAPSPRLPPSRRPAPRRRLHRPPGGAGGGPGRAGPAAGAALAGAAVPGHPGRAAPGAGPPPGAGPTPCGTHARTHARTHIPSAAWPLPPGARPGRSGQAGREATASSGCRPARSPTRSAACVPAPSTGAWSPHRSRAAAAAALLLRRQSRPKRGAGLGAGRRECCAARCRRWMSRGCC
jgi:hypothetical protein